jgi:hypothetical protein
MGEIQGRDRRLADVGVDVARQTAEPGLDRIHRLAHAGEVASLDGLFDQAQTIVGNARVLVPDRHGRGDISLPDEIGAELLQGHICVERLVGGVRIH